MESVFAKSIPFEEVNSRITALQAAMAPVGLQGALIVQRADLYYFSGTAQDAHLFVPMEGEPLLMVRKSLERAQIETPLESVVRIKSLTELRKTVKSACVGKVRALGMELDVLPVNNYRLYEELFPDARIIDVSQTIREIRMIKSPYEVELIREAGRLNDSMFGQAREILKEGMTEVELSGSLEAFLRERGHLGLCRARGFNQEVFYGHIMSGPNLAVPSCSLGPTGGPGLNASVPQGAGLRVIKRNEPIQIDYLCVLNGYMVDQGRVFSLGEPPAKFRRLHSVALAIQEALVRAGVPGTPAEQLYETAVRMAQDAGVSTGFMGYPQSVPFVGHGVGLEVDELPLLGKKSPHVLQEGMIIAMEPKFIVPREGLAGIENTFVVTEKGLEKLTLFDDSMQVIGSN